MNFWVCLLISLGIHTHLSQQSCAVDRPIVDHIESFACAVLLSSFSIIRTVFHPMSGPPLSQSLTRRLRIFCISCSSRSGITCLAPRMQTSPFFGLFPETESGAVFALMALRALFFHDSNSPCWPPCGVCGNQWGTGVRAADPSRTACSIACRCSTNYSIVYYLPREENAHVLD